MTESMILFIQKPPAIYQNSNFIVDEYSYSIVVNGSGFTSGLICLLNLNSVISEIPAQYISQR